MREKPILFSAPMVRAILDGRKTQTRRLVTVGDTIAERDDGTRWPYFTTWSHGDDGEPWAACPYGASGDRLWVRETFCLRDPEHHPERGYWYAATDDVDTPRWTPSIHMPRRASRLTLAVTAVRVERLQAISETDARAEGIQARCDHGCSSLCGCASCIKDGCQTAAAKYAELWDSINGDRAAWASNPWVWVVEFRRVM